MFYLYTITSPTSDKVYYGYTNSPKRRVASHRHSSKTKNTKLYTWMRKHPEWVMEVLQEFPDKESALVAERQHAPTGDLNIAPGGEGGFVITDKAAWIEKLRKGRVGGKPALGLRHTPETKAKLREATLARPRKFPDSVLDMSFADAHKTHGISKSHYYRLLQRAKSNDLD